MLRVTSPVMIQQVQGILQPWKAIKTEMRTAPMICSNKEQIDVAARFITNIIKVADIPKMTIRSGSKRRRMKRRDRFEVESRKWMKLNWNTRLTSWTVNLKKNIQMYEERSKSMMWETANDKSQYGFYKLARRLFKKGTPKSTFPIKDSQGKLPDSDEGRIQEFKQISTVSPKQTKNTKL